MIALFIDIYNFFLLDSFLRDTNHILTKLVTYTHFLNGNVIYTHS